MSSQVKHGLATWGLSEAAIKHHGEVLIPLSYRHIYVLMEFTIQLLTVKYNPSCFKFLLLSDVMGSRMKQVTLNSIKQNVSETST